jgi:MOSC domain-containing protein YiiM
VLTIAELKQNHAQAGRVEWIGLCTERRGHVQSVSEVEAEEGRGLTGDHHGKKRKLKRQVTLIQAEHLPVVASIIGRSKPIEPELLRRNIVVSGVSLLALKDQQFRIGEALLEGSGPAAPCSRMEENLGEGGYNAMRGHGGITARVIESGMIAIGDSVTALPAR